MSYFTVYGSFAHFSPRYMKLADKQFEPLLEVALQQERSEVLLNWPKQIPSQVPIPQRQWKSRHRSSAGLSSVRQCNGAEENKRVQRKRWLATS